MERDDLKLLWKELNPDNSCIDEIKIKNAMNMKHSKRISEILSGRKKEMLVYGSVFIVFIALMIYAFIILRISFSFFPVFLFSFLGMFLFFKTTHAISTFTVLSKESENSVISDSVKLFSKMLKRIQLIDFIVNVIFFYTLAVILIIVFLNEIKMANKLNIIVPIISVIFSLFLIPWLIKWLHSKRYKRFYSKLKNSIDDVEEAH